MATAPLHRRPTYPTNPATLPATGNGRDTDLLKEVPDPKVLRERIREGATELAAGLDKSRPPARHEMEAHARQVLAGL